MKHTAQRGAGGEQRRAKPGAARARWCIWRARRRLWHGHKDVSFSGEWVVKALARGFCCGTTRGGFCECGSIHETPGWLRGSHGALGVPQSLSDLGPPIVPAYFSGVGGVGGTGLRAGGR
ncbi:hypothetical protein H4R20_000693 [Coemansia guatemalensis]|uniref:Uncharacterized protein n=1 Tax=Coemansia guatemalensis TaxID=2761395 RepID=A0A9W8LTX3_9FUNG|nr:hypothetical protein H4R20_000693 [Coemansia guatemalensis]